MCIENYFFYICDNWRPHGPISTNEEDNNMRKCEERKRESET